MSPGTKIFDKRQYGQWLGNQGNIYCSQGRYQNAAEKYEEASVIANETGDRKRESMWLCNLGYVYMILGRYREAGEKSEVALEIAREVGDKKVEGVILGNLGLFYVNRGQYDEAAEKHKEALMIAQELGDRDGQGKELGNLGNIYHNTGKYDEAAEKFQMALEIAREIGDRSKEGTWLGNLGNVYSSRGEYDKAAVQHKAGLAIAREIGDRKGEGWRLDNLASVYCHLGKYNKSLECYEEALAIAREIGDRNGEHWRLGNLGGVHSHLGRYDDAAGKLQAALAIAREIEDKNGEGKWSSRLGGVYKHLGQYQKAFEKYEEALVIAREIGDRAEEGGQLGNLGIVYINLGQYKRAAEKFYSALAIAREIGDRYGECSWLGNLGNVHRELREYEKAAEKCHEGLAIARDIGDRSKECEGVGSLGNAHCDLGLYDEAVENYTEAIKIAREIGERSKEGLWLGNLGVCHYENNDKHERRQIALDCLKKSIGVLDDLWNDIKKDDQRVTFDDVNGSSSYSARYLQSLYWDMGQFEDALVTCEDASSKSLELLLLEMRINELVVDDHFFEPSSPSTKFEKMKNAAQQSKSAIIIYDFHVDDDILIWVIKSGTINVDLIHKKVHVKKDRKSLCHLVELTRRCLGARERNHSNEKNRKRESLSFLTSIDGIDEHTNNFDDLLNRVEDQTVISRKAQDEPIDGLYTINHVLRELYDLLIHPIQDTLADEQRLTIVPSGDLFALPFAALLDKNGKHLIQKHVLSFAPSIGTLIELKKNNAIARGKKGSAVIIGTGSQLSGARQEAEILHKVIESNGQREAKKFIGNEATKETVVDAMQSADIIHMATHGSKDGIFLSGPTGEDVKLTMGEVQRLNLRRANMVVLSACDTFKGELRTDGVVGITRAFLAAGSSTVIASLWPVNDNSTKELMIRLYQYLLKTDVERDGHHDEVQSEGAIDVCYALQQVMIGMLKEDKGHWFEVKHWAPFLVYGLNTNLDG